MYERFFGLAEPPFSITPDPRYLYLGEQHTEALAHLVYGVERGGGFIQLTGEVGTGKTTLIRRLLEQLPEDVEVALVLNPRLDPREFILATCEELGVPLEGEGPSIKSLVDQLNIHLLRLHSKGRRAVLIVDEAQELARDVLEQVRLLTNLETEREKLLQMILIGQPELRDTLAREDLRQLAQRITARFHLVPLSREEVASYVRHRVQVAGGRDGLFTSGGLKEVARRAEGIPRLINVLCDRALLAAYTSEHREVSTADVYRAYQETYNLEPSPWPRRVAYGAAATLALMLALMLVPRAVPVPMVEPVAASDGVQAAASEPVAEVPATPDAHTVTEAQAALSLSEVLEGTPRDLAFLGLSRFWSLGDAVGDRATLCTAAQAAGLACDRRRGSLTTVAAMGLPVVLELALPDGTLTDAMLISARGDELDLQTVQGPKHLPDHALAGAWHGDFVVIWRPRQGVTETLWPGSRAGANAWLRDALSRIQGPVSSGEDPLSYDAPLRDAVRRFQREVGLRPDGIAGTETLIALSAALDLADAGASG